jgi:bidirectional [NiFe] hydrogenase diaphorase subunit
MPSPQLNHRDVRQGHPSGDSRYKVVDRALKRNRYQQDALIEVLTNAQEAFGYLPEQVLAYVSEQLKLPLSWVYGVATFYHFFSLKPQGEHSCIVCLGTACYVANAADILTAIHTELDIEPGQTTKDGKLTLTATRCLGSCGLAPVVVFDNKVMGKETPETTLKKIRTMVKGWRETSPAEVSPSDNEDPARDEPEQKGPAVLEGKDAERAEL